MDITTTPNQTHEAAPLPASVTAPSNGDPEDELPSDPTDTGPAPSPSGRWIDNTPALLAGDRLVLTVTEAGALLGLSRAFAYELVSRGEIPVIRLGRRIVVPKAALLELVGNWHSGN
jgi:excisionase family DNA binding protein